MANLISESSNPNIADNFTTFITNWFTHRQLLFQDLLDSIDNNDSPKNQPQEALIERFLSHYRTYYAEKSFLAREGIFLMLSSPWLTPFERTFLWISDFRPTLLLRLIFANVSDLTAEQVEDLERLRAETRVSEKQLTDAMSVLQESVASPRLLGLLRRGTRLVNGELLGFEAAIAELKEQMVLVVESADRLRIATVRKVKEILGTDQMVKFLVAAVQFQLSIRSRGLHRGNF